MKLEKINDKRVCRRTKKQKKLFERPFDCLQKPGTVFKLFELFKRSEFKVKSFHYLGDGLLFSQETAK